MAALMRRRSSMPWHALKVCLLQTEPRGPALAAVRLRYAGLSTCTAGGSGERVDRLAKRRRAADVSCIDSVCSAVLPTALRRADVAACLCLLRCCMHVLCLLIWFRGGGGYCCADSGQYVESPSKALAWDPRTGARHILFCGHIRHGTHHFLCTSCFPSI